MQKFMQLKNYLPELSFLALLIRIMCVGAGIGEALVFGFIVISIGYREWLTKSKVDEKELINSRMDAVEKTMDEKFNQIFAKFNNQNMEQKLRKGHQDEIQTGQVRKRNF